MTLTLVRRLLAAGLLLGMASTLGGCVIAPVGPGWCYWHPYRCR